MSAPKGKFAGANVAKQIKKREIMFDEFLQRIASNSSNVGLPSPDGVTPRVLGLTVPS